jgi:hypothetical protein
MTDDSTPTAETMCTLFGQLVDGFRNEVIERKGRGANSNRNVRWPSANPRWFSGLGARMRVLALGTIKALEGSLCDERGFEEGRVA